MAAGREGSLRGCHGDEIPKMVAGLGVVMATGQPRWLGGLGGGRLSCCRDHREGGENKMGVGLGSVCVCVCVRCCRVNRGKQDGRGLSESLPWRWSNQDGGSVGGEA